MTAARQRRALQILRDALVADQCGDDARFLRERRILARLSHPNLAHFIDGGVSTDGRPCLHSSSSAPRRSHAGATTSVSTSARASCCSSTSAQRFATRTHGRATGNRFGYRLSRFVWRNCIAVGSAAVALIALVAAGTFAFYSDSAVPGFAAHGNCAAKQRWRGSTWPKPTPRPGASRRRKRLRKKAVANAQSNYGADSVYAGVAHRARANVRVGKEG